MPESNATLTEVLVSEVRF